AEAELDCLLCEKLVRDLEQDAGAVAGLRIGTNGAAMLEVLQDAQAIRDNLVALDIADIGDETDAASIVLMASVIKPVRWTGTFREQSQIRLHGQAFLCSASAKALRLSRSLASHFNGRSRKPCRDPT